MSPQTFDPRNYQIVFEEAIKCPQFRLEFQQFLEEHHNQESILFINKVVEYTEEYKKITSITIDTFSMLMSKENSVMLNNIYEYLCAKIAELMQIDKDLIQTSTVQSQILQIVKNYTSIYFDKLKSTPLFKLDSIPQFPSISTLFNDESTSDITIKIGNSKTIFGHKSILSSNSSYFETLFQIGEQFKDLQNNTYEIECDEFDESLHDIVIKYCYGIFDFDQQGNLIQFMKCASFNNLNKVMDYCAENIEINPENVESVKSELEFIQHAKLTKRIQKILQSK